MQCRSSLFLTLAACFATSSPCWAQQEDSPEQALEEISDWLGSKLKRFGRFSLRLTDDWSHVRLTVEDSRSVEARHEIRDVSFEKCELRYTSYFIPPGTSRPLFWQVALPLRVVHIPSTRIQRYELPMQLRATRERYEVVLVAHQGSEGFTVTDYDRRRRTVWEYHIPIERKGNAEQVAETLRHAAQLCGAK